MYNMYKCIIWRLHFEQSQKAFQVAFILTPMSTNSLWTVDAATLLHLELYGSPVFLIFVLLYLEPSWSLYCKLFAHSCHVHVLKFSLTFLSSFHTVCLEGMSLLTHCLVLLIVLVSWTLVFSFCMSCSALSWKYVDMYVDIYLGNMWTNTAWSIQLVAKCCLQYYVLKFSPFFALK